MDGKVGLASEAKATTVLPGMFPPGVAAALPDAAERLNHVLPDDAEQFSKHLKCELAAAIDAVALHIESLR